MSKRNAFKSGSISKSQADALESDAPAAAVATETNSNEPEDMPTDESFFVESDDGSMSLSDLEKLETEETPEKTPEAKAKEPEKEPDHAFDKARQQEQQELANYRRELPQYLATLKQQAQTIQQLQAQMLKNKQSPPAETNNESDDVFTINEDDPIGSLKQMAERMKLQDKYYQDMKNRIASYEESELRRQDAEKANELKSEYDGFFAKMDRAFGAQNRNLAKEYAKQMAKDDGYTCVNGDVPSPQLTKSYLRAGYIQAQGEEKLRTAQEAGKPAKSKQDVTQTGRVSNSTKTDIKPGSFKEVVRQMKEQNEFDAIFQT